MACHLSAKAGAPKIPDCGWIFSFQKIGKLIIKSYPLVKTEDPNSLNCVNGCLPNSIYPPTAKTDRQVHTHPHADAAHRLPHRTGVRKAKPAQHHGNISVYCCTQQGGLRHRDFIPSNVLQVNLLGSIFRKMTSQLSWQDHISIKQEVKSH